MKSKMSNEVGSLLTKSEVSLKYEEYAVAVWGCVRCVAWDSREECEQGVKVGLPAGSLYRTLYIVDGKGNGELLMLCLFAWPGEGGKEQDIMKIVAKSMESVLSGLSMECFCSVSPEWNEVFVMEKLGELERRAKATGVEGFGGLGVGFAEAMSKSGEVVRLENVVTSVRRKWSHLADEVWARSGGK